MILLGLFAAIASVFGIICGVAIICASMTFSGLSPVTGLFVALGGSWLCIRGIYRALEKATRPLPIEEAVTSLPVERPVAVQPVRRPNALD